MKVLIVDDKVDARIILRKILQANGVVTVEAPNGEEALKLLQSETVDLIISDILMPVMDGFLLCRRCRESERLKSIPFVFCTATYLSAKDESFAYDLGADLFVRKPVAPDVLWNTVQEVMAEKGEKEVVTKDSFVKDEEESYKLYSERLVKKLEKKVIELEEEISRHKKTGIALKESEMLKENIIESSPDCIKLLDLDGNLRYMSHGGQKVLEITDIDKYLGKSWIEFWEGDDRKKAKNAVDRASRGTIGRFHGFSPSASGRPCWWDVIITPIYDAAGLVSGLLAVSRDITEKKRRDENVIQLQKMESLGILAGGIAHDFNNILSSLIGYTQLSLEVADPGSVIADNLQEVYTAANRAKELVRQILAFARQTNEPTQAVEVGSIIKEVLKLMRASIPATIEIHEELASDSCTMANPTQLHQIVMNLCTNAAHAMEKAGGVLRVGVRDVAVQSDSLLAGKGLKPGNFIEIQISDTGVGIASGVMGSIFEPYFTTKAPDIGTGLGLSVVKGIVEEAGGIIEVESQLDKGTIFSVYLPVTESGAGRGGEAKEDQQTGSERILLVDDEVQLARMCQRILESLGYRVTTSNDSREALELFRANPGEFDLVITDLHMPGMSGDALAEEIVGVRGDIPVVLFTGDDSRGRVNEKLARYIKGFAFKPMVKAELAKTVRMVLDDGRLSGV